MNDNFRNLDQFRRGDPRFGKVGGGRSSSGSGGRVLASAAFIALALAILPSRAHAVAVGLELALVVDVSGSIDHDEYVLQMEGYARAFEDSVVRNAIANTPGGIVVNMVHFATTAREVIGWTHLTDAASLDSFASVVRGTPRGVFAGSTNISAGMVLGGASLFDTPPYGLPFAGNGYEGERLVIDVSGDGIQNLPGDPAYVRDLAELAGITVNGLAIGGDALVAYYQDKVQTSDGFTVQAVDFAAFERAVIEKVRREIGGGVETPEPGRALFSLLGMLAAVMTRRRSHR